MRSQLNLLSVDQDRFNVDLEKKRSEIKIRSQLNLLPIDQDHLALIYKRKRIRLRSEIY